MKPLLLSLCLLLAGTLVTAWQGAEAAILAETRPVPADSPATASHSCDNRVREERVDQVDEKLSKKASKPDSTRSSREKQRSGEQYAQHHSDLMTGERCTRYAHRPSHRQEWLALTLTGEDAFSEPR